MINKSKKGDPGQWRKWREAGSLEKHPDQEWRERRAELVIEPPDGIHFNYTISFNSEGRDKKWKQAYILAIMDVTKERGWQPFFQTGQDLEKTYQAIELWDIKDLDTIKASLEEIHEVAQKRIDKHLKTQS